MLLFIAITATLNLGIGYVLGVYIGVMPSLPALPRRKPAEPPEADLDLTAPPKPSKAAKAKPAADPASDPAPDGKPEPVTAEATGDEPEPAAKPTKPSRAEVMDGLAAFQAQLAKASEDLQENVDDDEAFDECTGRLQEANHAFLEKAQTTIDELGDDPTDSEAADCRDVLEENAKRVGEKSDEIDAMLADGAPDAETRKKLISTTESLGESVAEAGEQLQAQVEDESDDESHGEANGEGGEGDDGESVEDASETADAIESADADDDGDDERGNEDEVAEAEEASADEAEGDEAEGDRRADRVLDADSRLTTLSGLMETIAEELKSDDRTVVVAALQRDPVEPPDGADATDIESRLLAGITELVGETLGDAHMMAPDTDNRLLILLSGESGEEASQRIERLRQDVENARFVADGAEFTTTATGAVAEAVDEVTCDELLEQVGEALAEGDRHGRNRSYHHDGRFPAPVMPDEYSPNAKTLTI